MTIKDKFIEEINIAIDEGKIVLSEEANQYLTSLQKVVEKPKFTENGKKILVYMQDNYKDNNNIFNAKGIGEGLFLSSRGVSGALRKLVTDGYAEKMGTSPVCYSLTQQGIEENIE